MLKDEEKPLYHRIKSDKMKSNQRISIRVPPTEQNRTEKTKTFSR